MSSRRGLGQFTVHEEGLQFRDEMLIFYCELILVLRNYPSRRGAGRSGRRGVGRGLWKGGSGGGCRSEWGRGGRLDQEASG